MRYFNNKKQTHAIELLWYNSQMTAKPVFLRFRRLMVNFKVPEYKYKVPKPVPVEVPIPLSQSISDNRKFTHEEQFYL